MKLNLHRLVEKLVRQDAGAIGGTVAFVLALLLVIFGFWKTLFIVILSLVGYYVGARFFSNPDTFRRLLDRIFPPGRFR
ncbi:MAG: DUF2273 domain-containing protein [Clostridiaceae bacterium]|nr:DUF2273 domain-containing protein [Clostridiaceae bacterium]NLZ69935.1 DUF2273 domain-containing protein [Clostridiaceae bacterium]